jgi:hypothetical protein
MNKTTGLLMKFDPQEDEPHACDMSQCQFRRDGDVILVYCKTCKTTTPVPIIDADDVPLVEGGQGRTYERVTATERAVLLLLVAMTITITIAGLVKLAEWIF